jgi:hypothetical protein
MAFSPVCSGNSLLFAAMKGSFARLEIPEYELLLACNPAS